MSFFVLQSDGGLFGTRWAYGLPFGKCRFAPAERCPVCGGAVSLMRWLPPHRLKLSNANPAKWGAFLWGAGFYLMVSSHLKATYEGESLQGVTLFDPPAEVMRLGTKKAEQLTVPLPVYHQIEIVWNGANLDDVASGAVRKHMDCSFHRGSVESVQRIVLEEGSWNGADIFWARGLPGVILVSERFRAVVQAHGLGGALFIPADKYAYDEHRPGLWYVRED